MKATLFLAVFAALAAAAPQGASSGVLKRASDDEITRCGVSDDDKCAEGEKCVGVYKLKDQPGGLCVKEPIMCGGENEHESCPDDHRCLRDSSSKCPSNLYCGWCVEKRWIDKFQYRSNGMNRCGGSSGKECYKGAGEVCVGEDVMLDGMGVCLENPGNCLGERGEKMCPINSDYGPGHCVKDPRQNCTPGDKDCSGICLDSLYTGGKIRGQGSTSSTPPSKTAATAPTSKPMKDKYKPKPKPKSPSKGGCKDKGGY
ncbi:hypothetical protein TWF506_007521 [Arthrobotrys conoides]|uniref:Uncharacterized protein n=1 Tax=Arthrobotrys conoides TaxID=74498 RepID=A0AAN8NKE4_9PEZI